MKQTKAVLSTEVIGKSTYHENGRSGGSFKNVHLSSAYQPIFSLAHKRIVGYEALVRAENDQNRNIRPDVLFRQGECLADIVFLDRLCRYIHVDNFRAFSDKLNWLFLNVSPQTIIHGVEYGSFFGTLLEKFGIPSYRIVIEIVEHPISKEDGIRLLDTVKYYQDIGCLIAIDDFGAGHSNFERIWTLKPNIVKLDRSMLLRASAQPDIRQLFQGIVSLIHQAGSLVLVEGIETEAEALIAMESDADFVQGYFFSKPHHDLKKLSSSLPPFDMLFDLYKASEALRGEQFQHTYNRYYKSFQAAAAMLELDFSLTDSSKPLFKNESMVRCYLLEPSGLQIGQTIVSKSYVDKADVRFKPLEDANSADWFRRHYLRRAIMHPDQLQITRPYLSITGAHMCSTLSMMFRTRSGDKILCCDLKL
jgi:EAL domain-containing protein (putative c-di-GMP-specific phosphodiesterase class I)